MPPFLEEDLRWAAEVLGLPERASLKAIKARRRDLLARWHPDACRDHPELCKEMAQRINRAYEIVLSYCENYEYPFGEEERKREKKGSYERWWQERFGDDPLWGGTKRKGEK
jgi:DnaJ-class molecular chaperone